MIHVVTFVELAVDVNAQRRIKQETAGKMTKGPSNSGSLFALSGLLQILGSSAAACEMSHTGN